MYYIYISLFRKLKGTFIDVNVCLCCQSFWIYTLTVEIKWSGSPLSTNLFTLQRPIKKHPFHLFRTHYSALHYIRCFSSRLTLKSVSCPEVNPNAITASGETVGNVNCYSAVDLLIMLPSRISLWGMSPWFVRSRGVVLADLKTKNIMIVDHLQQPLRAKVMTLA